jgi:hypothetical protein
MSKMTKKVFQDLLTVAMDESRDTAESLVALRGLVEGVNSVRPGLFPPDFQVKNGADATFAAKIIVSHIGEIVEKTPDD